MPSTSIIQNHPEIRRCVVSLVRRENGVAQEPILRPDAECVSYQVSCGNKSCDWKRQGLGFPAASQLTALVDATAAARDQVGSDLWICGGSENYADGVTRPCPMTIEYSIEITYR